MFVKAVVGALMLTLLFTPVIGEARSVFMRSEPAKTAGENTPANQAAKETPGLISARVISVIDGDTIRVAIGRRRETVRLIGVNAPEVGRSAEPFGKEARKFARENLNRKTVWLETTERQRDRHDRILAYVWLQKPENPNEEFVRKNMFNAKLLLAGYAETLVVRPRHVYADMFETFQEEAKNAGKRANTSNSPPAQSRTETSRRAGR